MRNLLIAQSGGPTAAINATVSGVIKAAYESDKIDEVFGAINGIEGVMEERFLNFRDCIKSEKDLQLLSQTPAAALGSCRLKLKSMDKDKDTFEKIIDVFRKHDISYFIYIGGNDSMDTVDKLSAFCVENNITGITIVGAPKTIDNDLVKTDHCPGFGSAAKYIGVTFAELERDCSVYNSKAVTIVEVMGRNTGWLTAASALARVNGAKGPNLIYLCESIFNQDQFLIDVKAQLENYDSVLIAVSEGIKNREGEYLSEQMQSGAKDAFGHSYIAGAARVLENLVREKIGCKVRSIELNLMQRCAGHLVSATDIKESKLLGMKACHYVTQNQTGIMPGLVRKDGSKYEVEIIPVPVCEVSNYEKKVPAWFINKEGNDVTKEMMDYLFPLIQGEVEINYKNGIPEHVKLY